MPITILLFDFFTLSPSSNTDLFHPTFTTSHPMFKKALSALRSVPKPAANLAPPARPAAIGPRELVWAGGVSLIAGGGTPSLSLMIKIEWY